MKTKSEIKNEIQKYIDERGIACSSNFAEFMSDLLYPHECDMSLLKREFAEKILGWQTGE